MHLEIRISVSRVTGRRAWKKGGKKEAQCPGEGIYNSRFGTMRTESVCVGRGHKSIDCLLAVTAHTKHTHTHAQHTHTHTTHKYTRGLIKEKPEDVNAKQVVRPYTPTTPPDTRGYLDLIVKVHVCILQCK
jgi:hypothetical protein